MIFKINQHRGFTLVELLVVIAIVAILAAVIILVINPLELIHRGRDATRIKNLDNLVQAINVSMQEAGMSSNSIVSILCKTSGSYPCSGSSNNGSRLTNGTGWLKADLTVQSSVTFPTLPIDPVNNANYHYTYCADQDKFEINAALESNSLGSKAYSDGGNTGDHYEVGSSLTLIANSGGSCMY